VEEGDEGEEGAEDEEEAAGEGGHRGYSSGARRDGGGTWDSESTWPRLQRADRGRLFTISQVRNRHVERRSRSSN
jgi:hypothetical protein